MMVENESLAESFASIAAAGVRGDVALVVPRPWRREAPPPAGVLAPRLQPDGELALNPEEVKVVSAERKLVLLVCTLETAEAELARVLPGFYTDNRTCVFMALILPSGEQDSQELNDRILEKYSQALGFGIDEVLINPSPEPDELWRAIRVAQSVVQLNVRRMQHMVDSDPEPVTTEQLARLKVRHRGLWDSIPRALMPYFPPIDRELVEEPRALDRYTLLRQLGARHQKLILAVDDCKRPHVVKAIDKGSVTTLCELECIYREYRFLSAIIQHPHIVKCSEMLHSSDFIYLIFELGGNMNLEQAIQPMPGQRLTELEAVDVFGQVAAGLAFCHARGVSHRQVSLGHVVVKRRSAWEGFACVIVDFRKAILPMGKATSTKVCGGLPFIAPEMALAKAYMPHFVDCWSLGVVLLEMAGGLGTMSRYVGYWNEAAQVAANVAERQLKVFKSPGSHSRALAFMGAVKSDWTSDCLAMLMRPEPNDRSPIREASDRVAGLLEEAKAASLS
mmetsp:Transcript_71793/g.210338  ORF Transcript_71793/g.210338 Transcript_71793/m.210338 type:complete len:506 (+) Transcript_71793:100-1617(+)